MSKEPIEYKSEYIEYEYEIGGGTEEDDNEVDDEIEEDETADSDASPEIPTIAGAEEWQISDNIIQYIMVAVIVVVIATLAWIYIPRPQPKASIPPFGSTSSVGICKQFDSILIADQYDAPPMKVNAATQYFANFKMAKGGEFVVQLYADKAPITVNSFIFLSCKGYFNGLTFHRVLEGFMAQGGDPTGSGSGGPGYEFVNEDSDLTFNKAGVMAMANAGPDTNGSQFFITVGAAGHLNGGYTIFGQVIEGMDVVNGITLRDPQQDPTFEGDVMELVTISEK